MDNEERQQAAGETASIYLPMDRRQAMASGQTLPVRMMGAALLANLSGFMPLTEALGQAHGVKRGAEEVTRQLNRVYGPLIEAVHNYHGSVIGFSGDAMTCWFNGLGEAEPEEGASLRALACAVAMQAAMRQFASVQTPAGAAFSIGLRVAVAAGPVRRLLAGDPRLLQVEVLAGRTMDDLAAAENQAGWGEIVVPGRMVAGLDSYIVVPEWRRGRELAVVSGLSKPVPAWPWPTVPPGSISDSQAQPWLAPGVFEKVRAGKSDLLSELRLAAALFMQFGGVDYDNEAGAGQKLNAFVSWVEEVVDRQAGTVLQITVGTKGSYLYIAFGVPVAASGANDAAQAVGAALELMSPSAEAARMSGIQIGVSYGQMWAGVFGSPAQRTYGAMGDPTNLAARLMQAANGGILCDGGIFRAAQDEFEFGPLPLTRVEGKAQPVAVYRPLRRRRTAW